MDVYYDDEKEAWVEKSLHYSGTIHTVSSIIPVPKGTTYDEAKERLSNKVTKVFTETFVDSKHLELINALRIEHYEDLYSTVYDMEKELFGTTDVDKRDKISYKYWKRFKEVSN